jgi:hypothetical protein
MPRENPFVFDRPLEDTSGLIGRDEELAALISIIQSRDEGLLEGPHRHGKTSLINAALASLAADAVLGVRIDCSGVLTVDDVLGRLEDAYAQARADGPLEAALLERLEALRFRIESTEAPEPVTRLQALLGVADEVGAAVDGHAAVCFDEFQDAVPLPALAQAIEGARAQASGRVAYVFAGREFPEQQSSLWSKRTPKNVIGTIEPTLFAKEIARRFAETSRDAGEAAQIIATVGAGHPQRTTLLAWQLWELIAGGERATALSARLAINEALKRIAPELEIRWQALHSNERRVAVAIANGLPPQGTRAQRATGLAGFGAAQRAVQGIKSSGVAQMRDDRVTLTDPLFAEWLRRRYPQAAPEPGYTALRRRDELRRGGMTPRI